MIIVPLAPITMNSAIYSTPFDKATSYSSGLTPTNLYPDTKTFRRDDNV